MPVCVIICNLPTNIGHPDITPLVGVSDMCFLPCCDTTALEIGTCKKSVSPFPKGRFPESVEEENFRETGCPRCTFKMTDNWRIVHTYMHLYCTQCRAQGLNLYIHVYTCWYTACCVLIFCCCNAVAKCHHGSLITAKNGELYLTKPRLNFPVISDR